MRRKIESRIRVSPEKKQLILAKSDNKCAHCGKLLSKKSATIDHAVPISKGGTNSDENLVALCFDCNSDKVDSVVDPRAYFKYLLPEHLAEILQYHKNYYEDISWLTPKNYMKEDKIEVYYDSTSSVLQGRCVKRGNSVYAKTLVHTAVLYKATYDDLNDVRDFLMKYHKKYDLPVDGMDDAISDIYSKGCIYILKRGIEMLALFPVVIERDYVIGENEKSYIVSFSGIPVLYQRPEYSSLIINCVKKITMGAVMANGKNIAVYEIYNPLKDQYISSIVSDIANHGKCRVYENDGWERTIMCQRWVSFKGELDGYDFDPLEDIRYFSRSLERIMGLKPANNAKISKMEPKKQKTETKCRTYDKERRRMMRDQMDEYDIRYYM